MQAIVRWAGIQRFLESSVLTELAIETILIGYCCPIRNSWHKTRPFIQLRIEEHDTDEQNEAEVHEKIL